MLVLRGSMNSIIGAQSAHFSISENSTGTQGEHEPFPLMTKGESDLMLPSSPKGEIVGIMTQVLSLMATHSDDISQYNRLTTKSYISDFTEWRKRGICRFTISQAAYTCGFIVYKLRIRTHALSKKEKFIYLGKLSFWFEVFGPWYFDPWYWSKVSGLRYWP